MSFVDKTVDNTIDKTEEAGEKLLDHGAPILIQVIQKIFDCLWQTRISFEKRNS